MGMLWTIISWTNKKCSNYQKWTTVVYTKDFCSSSHRHSAACSKTLPPRPHETHSNLITHSRSTKPPCRRRGNCGNWSWSWHRRNWHWWSRSAGTRNWKNDSKVAPPIPAVAPLRAVFLVVAKRRPELTCISIVIRSTCMGTSSCDHCSIHQLVSTKSSILLPVILTTTNRWKSSFIHLNKNLICTLLRL